MCRIYTILDCHTAPGGHNPDWHSDNATDYSAFWDYKVSEYSVTPEIYLISAYMKLHAPTPIPSPETRCNTND